jgi:CheY-like chemotaxis protein
MHSSRSQTAQDARTGPSGNGHNGHNGNGKTNHREGGSRRTDNQGLKKTILFVDDEAPLLEVRRVLFEALNYSVLTACSGEDALNLLQERSVDAVVLDYLMPTMDGEETARRMRQLDATIPILLSSGCLDLPKSLLEIVDASIDKGRGPLVLIKTLEPLLQRRALHDGSSLGVSAGPMAG